MRLKTLTVIVLFATSLVLFSCKKDDEAAKQAEIDEQIILDYLAEKEIDAQRHESGLYYLILREGSGVQPSDFSSVEVYYKGYFPSGNIFDQTTQGSLVLFLPDMIRGWQIGIPLLKKGGKGLFLIPSGLGYGKNGSFLIPPNKVLIFEVDLVDVF